MLSRTKIYISDDVIVTLGAVIIDSGRADGSWLTIDPEGNIAEDEIGNDGEVVVSRTNDNRATVKIKLMKSSLANDGLSILATAMRKSPRMVGAIVPFSVVDINGRSTMKGTHAWVRKLPSKDYDKKAGTVEWEVRVSHLIRTDGGY